MLYIHLYMKDGSEHHKPTNRVTKTDGGSQQLLILGAGAKQEVFDMLDVAWFWIEEE